MKKSSFLRFMSLYPPYIGAGVRVKRFSGDLREVDVEMKLRWWNRNYLGTHFGGSLYTMVDPFFVLMLVENLGPGYAVWDKEATIRFLRPGRGRVRASMRITGEEVEALKREVGEKGRAEPQYKVEVLDDSGAVVAEVHKVLSVKPRTGHGGKAG